MRVSDTIGSTLRLGVRDTFLRALQKSQHFSFFRYLISAYYKLAFAAFLTFIPKQKTTRAVALKGSMASGGASWGLSDVDFVWLIHDKVMSSKAFWTSSSRRLRVLRALFPILSVPVCLTEEEWKEGEGRWIYRRPSEKIFPVKGDRLLFQKQEIVTEKLSRRSLLWLSTQFQEVLLSDAMTSVEKNHRLDRLYQKAGEWDLRMRDRNMPTESLRLASWISQLSETGMEQGESGSGDWCYSVLTSEPSPALQQRWEAFRQKLFLGPAEAGLFAVQSTPDESPTTFCIALSSSIDFLRLSSITATFLEEIPRWVQDCGLKVIYLNYARDMVDYFSFSPCFRLVQTENLSLARLGFLDPTVTGTWDSWKDTELMILQEGRKQKLLGKTHPDPDLSGRELLLKGVTF